MVVCLLGARKKNKIELSLQSQMQPRLESQTFDFGNIVYKIVLIILSHFHDEKYSILSILDRF